MIGFLLEMHHKSWFTRCEMHPFWVHFVLPYSVLLVHLVLAGLAPTEKVHGLVVPGRNMVPVDGELLVQR